MKLLITGGAGFIGSAVVRLAISKGFQIVNIDKLTYAANLNNLSQIHNSPLYKFYQTDIADQSAMDQIFNQEQPDAVLHLAAESHVDRSIDTPETFLQTNILGTYSLLQAARKYWNQLKGAKKHRFRFHHVSTDEVYGDLSETDPAFSETTPYNPSSPYSASKAASDHIVRAWHRTYGLPILITNCSNNYGPYQFPEKLIPVIILNALHNKPIPVYGTGLNIRDWLYVDDHAEALLHVLNKGQIGETYNIGGQNERTNLDVVKSVCRQLDSKIQTTNFQHETLIEFVKDRPGHDKRYAINAGKIKKDLGWEPSITKDDGLALTVDWYINNSDWWQPLLKRNSLGQRLGLST